MKKKVDVEERLRGENKYLSEKETSELKRKIKIHGLCSLVLVVVTALNFIFRMVWEFTDLKIENKTLAMIFNAILLTLLIGAAITCLINYIKLKKYVNFFDSKQANGIESKKD